MKVFLVALCLCLIALPAIQAFATERPGSDISEWGWKAGTVASTKTLFTIDGPTQDEPLSSSSSSGSSPSSGSGSSGNIYTYGALQQYAAQFNRSLLHKGDLTTGQVRNGGPNDPLVDEFEIDIGMYGDYDFRAMAVHPITGNIFGISVTEALVSGSTSSYVPYGIGIPNTVEVIEVDLKTGEVTSHDGFYVFVRTLQGISCTFKNNGNFYIYVDTYHDIFPWSSSLSSIDINEQVSMYNSQFSLNYHEMDFWLDNGVFTGRDSRGIVRYDLETNTYQKLEKTFFFGPTQGIEYYPKTKNLLTFNYGVSFSSTQDLEATESGLGANFDQLYVPFSGSSSSSSSSYSSCSIYYSCSNTGPMYPFAYPNGQPYLTLGGRGIGNWVVASYFTGEGGNSFSWTSILQHVARSVHLSSEYAYLSPWWNGAVGFFYPISAWYDQQSGIGNSLFYDGNDFVFFNDNEITHLYNDTFISSVSGQTDEGVVTWLMTYELLDTIDPLGASFSSPNVLQNFTDKALSRNVDRRFAEFHSGANIGAYTVHTKPNIVVTVDGQTVVDYMDTQSMSTVVYGQEIVIDFIADCDGCAQEKAIMLDISTPDELTDFNVGFDVTVPSTVVHNESVVLTVTVDCGTATNFLGFPTPAANFSLTHSFYEASFAVAVDFDAAVECRCGGSMSHCDVSDPAATVTCDPDGSNVVCSACLEGFSGDDCLDTSPPVIGAGPFNVSATDQLTPEEIWEIIYMTNNISTLQVTDASGSVSISLSYSPDAEDIEGFEVGVTMLYVHVTDGMNAANASFYVTVIDTEAPVVTCPDDILLVADETGYAVATWEYEVTDNSDFVTVNMTAAPNSSFSLGTTVVEITASDMYGTSNSSCSFNVIVEEVVDPCSSSPCLNNATCSVVNGGAFECACIAGYTGNYCEDDADDCASSPCYEQGTSNCFDLGLNMFECKCLVGYGGLLCDETQYSATIYYTPDGSVLNADIYDAVDEAMMSLGVTDYEVEISVSADGTYEITIDYYGIGYTEEEVHGAMTQTSLAGTGTLVWGDEIIYAEQGASQTTITSAMAGVTLLTLVAHL